MDRDTRCFSAIIFIQTLCLALLIVLSVVYFTKFVGLSASEIGIGLSLTAAMGVIAGIPIGHLSDRYNARGLFILLLAIQAAATFAYLLIDSFTSFLLVVGIYQFSDRASSAVRGALVARAIGPDKQATTRAYLRMFSQTGLALGALLSGLGLQIDSPAAFHVLFILSGCGYLLAMLAVLRLPSVAPVPREHTATATAVFSDVKFVGFVVLNTILCIHYAILEVGVPLWVLHHTQAPTWIITLLFVINTLLAVSFQLLVSRHAEQITAQKALLYAGALLFTCCVFFGLSSQMSLQLTLLLLVLGGVLYGLGVLYLTATSWMLAYNMSPAHAHGQYQGLFSMSISAGIMFGSSVVTFVAVDRGIYGWVMLGSLFAAASLVMSFWVSATPSVQEAG